jgi:hypothetical protein
VLALLLDRRLAMLSRSIGILIASWLPCLALMLPLSRFHTVNALVAGSVATVLAALSFIDDRARLGAAVVGVWVVFTPFVFRSTLLEMVIASCWGVTMFVSLMGPFCQPHAVTRVPSALKPAQPEAERLEFLAAA